MTNDFDFNRVGKRMPYTVPDGFFNKMEDDVWEEIGNEPIHIEPKPAKRRPLLRIVAIAATAAAAAAAAVVIAFLPTRTSSPDFADVEQAFCNLDADDQAYMLSVYQEDIFINQETN